MDRYIKVRYRGYDIVIQATGDTIENILYAGVYRENNGDYFYPKAASLFYHILCEEEPLVSSCLSTVFKHIEKRIDQEREVSYTIDKAFEELTR